MTAFVFLGIAFVFTIVNRLYAKKTLNALDTYGVTILSNTLSALVLLPYALYKLPEILALPASTLFQTLTLGVLWAMSVWSMNASIALNDFSFKEVIRQSRVMFVVLGGVLLLGETITALDMVGIGAIILSAIIVSWKKASLRDHLTSKPILLAWLSSLLIAIATLLEKQLLMEVEVFTYACFAFALPSLFLSLFLTQKRRSAIGVLFRHHKMEIVLFSSFLFIAYMSSLFAYKLLPISIAYPLIQSATVFAVIIGTALFENNHHWKRKAFAAFIAILGVVLIQL